jgi:membrane protein DedA with SNARE-associated domain
MHGGSLPVALHAVEAATRLNLHHHFTGPHITYVGLALAAFLSWVATTGPGEAALIAAGISAGHGHIDVVGMIIAAWAGAMAGGTAGWLVGLKGGRALITKPGPLHRLRLRLLRRGDAVYARRGWLAVFLAPSLMAGVAGMPARRFVPINAVAALAWAVGIGLGAYVAGPSIADAASDLGVIGLAALVALIALSAAARRLVRS